MLGIVVLNRTTLFSLRDTSVGTTIKVEGPGQVPTSVSVCRTAWSKGKNPSGQLPSLYSCQKDNLNVVSSRICDLLKVRLLNAINRANLWHRFKAKIGSIGTVYSHWSVGAVNRAICGLAVLFSQESNFVNHVHSSEFSVNVHMVS